MEPNELDDFIKLLTKAHEKLSSEKKQQYNRRVALGDLVTDREKNAALYSAGEGSSCYDNVLIIGDVKIGKHVWIGPNVILDGSGGLVIGDYVSISAGVQIYTHDTVAWATSMGQEKTQHAPVVIGSGVYLGPNSIIGRGVTIGDRVVIGAMSFVNKNIPSDARAWGAPAVIQAT